jgi:succinylglutamate desuccinylase
MQNPHIIDTYEGKQHGALLLIVTTLHGNEPAGEKAVNTVLRLLKEEEERNKAFEFKGKIVGLVANHLAKAKQKRYLDTDMNRIWTTERLQHIENAEKLSLAEERQAKTLLQTIRAEIAAYKPTSLYLLDLHTTTVSGGIFTVVPESKISEQIGLSLYAPVITGFANLLQGTLMTYFSGEFEGLQSVTLTFESGQHEDEDSVTNAVSAIINTMRATGCVAPQDVEDKHDERLRARAATLPRKAHLIYRHAISVSDNFKMRPGFQNFQPVKKKEILADDRKGIIRALDDALILMPLYQKQGNDGFFLIKAVEV